MTTFVGLEPGLAVAADRFTVTSRLQPRPMVAKGQIVA